MTTRPIVGGIRFLSNVTIDDADDSGFSDLDVSVEWVPQDRSLEGHPVKAPSGLTVWFHPDQASICLPILHDNTVVWAWQLRQVAPIVAARHGRLTVHASAVASDDRAVAFVGASEVGKSTLAWELVKSGAKPIADDLLPVRFGEIPHTSHNGQELPIEGICFLSRTDDKPTLTALSKTEAFEQHLVNGFGEHEDPDVWAYQFDAYHRLARDVAHYALRIPDDRSSVAATATWFMSELAISGRTT